MVICHPFLYNCIFGRYSRHSMVAFLNKKNVLKYKGLHENISNSYVIIFDTLQQLCHFSLEWGFSWHQMLAPPFTFGVIFYARITSKKGKTFILYFLIFYLCWVIYVIKIITSNIQCYLILRKESFYSQVWLIMVADNYVSIMVIWYPCNAYSLSGGNIRH